MNCTNKFDLKCQLSLINNRKFVYYIELHPNFFKKLTFIIFVENKFNFIIIFLKKI